MGACGGITHRGCVNRVCGRMRTDCPVGQWKLPFAISYFMYEETV